MEKEEIKLKMKFLSELKELLDKWDGCIVPYGHGEVSNDIHLSEYYNPIEFNLKYGEINSTIIKLKQEEMIDKALGKGKLKNG